MDYQRCSILTSYNFEQLIIPNWLHDIWGIQTSNWSTNEWWTWLPCCLGNKPRFGNIYMTRFVLGVDPETFKCKCHLPKSGICRLKHIVPGFTSTMLVQQQETAWHQPVWCCLHGCLWDRLGHFLEVNVRPLGRWVSLAQMSPRFLWFGGLWRAASRLSFAQHLFFLCLVDVATLHYLVLTLVFSIPRFITYLGLKHLPERIH